MSDYEIRYLLKNGRVGNSSISFSGDRLDPDFFCEHVRDNFNPQDISRLMVYENGKLIEGNLPPIWISHKGYVFSARGLEEIIPFDASRHNAITADYWVNEDCRKLDSIVSKIDNSKFEEFMKRIPSGVPVSQEDVLKYCGKGVSEPIPQDYSPDNKPKTSELTPKKPLRRILTSLVLDLEGRNMTKEEILHKVDEEGIFDMMKGPFKKFRVWFKLTNGLVLAERKNGLLKDYIFLKKNDNYEEGVYNVCRKTYSHPFY